MNDKFNQFVANLNNQSVEVSDSTNKFQCMDLAYLWTFALGFPKATIQHLYAYQVFTAPTDLTREHFDIIPNTPTAVPSVGDLVVFNKGSMGVAGHIAVISGDADVNRFKSFDQNFPIGSKCHLQEHNYNGVLGWLRPKIVTPTAEITDQTRIPQIDNLEVQAIRSIVNDSKLVAVERDKLKEKIVQVRTLLASE